MMEEKDMPNEESLAEFLRLFAEHVVRHTLHLASTVSRPEDIVDHIPAMSPSRWD